MNTELHERAMAFWDEAYLLEQHGNPEAAREKYEQAAAQEEQCVETVRADEPRSRGILSVSAVSMWIQAGRLDHAEALLRRYAEQVRPEFVREASDIIARKRTEMGTPGSSGS